MKKALFVLALTALMCGYLFFPPPMAKATACSGFYTWSTGDTITSARLNTINTVVTNCGNNIDNTNIGTAGIFASQIKGTSSANNTFGVTTAAATLNVPLILGASAITDNSLVELRNDNGGTNGLLFNVPTGSTNGFQLTVNGATYLQAAKGGIGGCTANAPTINSTNTLGCMPPVYTNAGASLGNTTHIVTGSNINYTVSGTCLDKTWCTASAGSSVSFTNAAVFTDGTTYSCSASWQAALNDIVLVRANNGTTANVQVMNQSGSSITNGTNLPYNYSCIGT